MSEFGGGIILAHKQMEAQHLQRYFHIIYVDRICYMDVGVTFAVSLDGEQNEKKNKLWIFPHQANFMRIVEKIPKK